MNSTPFVPFYWFKRWGWFYRPIHVLGWIASCVALAFLLHIFVVLDAQAHSVTDLLYHFYVFAAPTFLGLMWIGSRTSDENGGRG
ncbi:MAG: hypothetical protein KA257_03155 [Opitutaceae bacterium]|nr:hypothetical protein [Opitutaceae bacterium]MBP9912224.1 hypothetical protein [Opitutaceae bacterium]